MGKAALDLPDPLQTPPDEGKPLTSTDDLLARLAGEEIDRLLAEVDDQAGVGAAPLSLSPRTPVPSPEPKTGDSSPAPQAKAPDPQSADERTAAEIAAAAEPDLTAELDAFFKSAVPAPAAAAAPATADAHAPTAAAPTAIAPPLADLLETSHAERQGLQAPAPAPAGKAAASGTAADPTDTAVEATAMSGDSALEGGDAGALPLYLRPLEWINAPLEACPPALRDFIGKAAIITLVNAAAVLCYVLLFRRH
jgi:hypothetical protein